MKFSKLKKFLCLTLSLALLVAVLPATIASADLDSTALIILDEDYFEGTDVRVSDLTIDNPKGTTGIVSLAQDPKDNTNQKELLLRTRKPQISTSALIMQLTTIRRSTAI